MIEKIKNNPVISLIIVCSFVVPMSVGVTTWFYERQMHNIKTKHELDIAHLRNNHFYEIKELEKKELLKNEKKEILKAQSLLSTETQNPDDEDKENKNIHKDDFKIRIEDINGVPLEKATALIIFEDGTYLKGISGLNGFAYTPIPKRNKITIFAAHPNYYAFLKKVYITKKAINIMLKSNPKGGSIICETACYIPGLKGRLNPILDSISRTYLYADNIAINGGKPQPVKFEFNKPLILEDRYGNKFEIKINLIIADSALIDYRTI